MSATKKSIFLFLNLFLFTLVCNAQISAPNADASKKILNDSVYIFCGVKGVNNASLMAIAPMGNNAVFVWERYNENLNMFEPLSSNNGDSILSSNVYNLEDGAYKVIINDGSTVLSDFAWVVNNWIEITKAEIPDSTSNCDEFRMIGDFEHATLEVFDTITNQRIPVKSNPNDYDVIWKKGEEILKGGLSAVYSPPYPSDQPISITLSVTDGFGCSAEMDVDYNSKVTQAEFTYDPADGEAVLEVTFDNMSINYDSAIWFFYKDPYLYSIELEKAKGEPVDSIDFVLVEDSPIYSYDRSGDYRVKLVTVKMNDTGNCRDTFYMAAGDYIKVDTSLIDVPNVFTPNGDGINDVFVVKSQSLRSMNIKIYNRWGGLVHSWKYTNITSKDYTYEHSVWDGKIGNRMASPGVYYCIVTYEGRDWDKSKNRLQPKKKTENYVVHLFREKL